MISGSNCRHLNRPQTEEARMSIRRAYHGVIAKLQHFLDGSPAPSPPARRQAFFQKCTFDRRAVGAVGVPVGLAFHAPNATFSTSVKRVVNYRLTNNFSAFR